MPDRIIPFKVSLKNASDKEISNAVINVPNSHEFNNLPSGKYTVTITAPDNFELTDPKPSNFDFRGENNTIKVTIGLKDIAPSGSSPNKEDSANTPVGLIILAMLSAVLLANISMVEDFFSSFTPTKKTADIKIEQPSSKPTSSQKSKGYELPPELESNLRQCLKKNLKRLLNIPSLSDLIESLNDDKENSKSEFQEQTILLYKRVKELRATIEDCDPTLIQELITADNQQTSQSQSQSTVMIEGETVNVRAGQGLNYEVIARLPYGTVVQVDVISFSKLSEQQQLAIKKGEGWYPIIIPDGRKGYIYSLYIRE